MKTKLLFSILLLIATNFVIAQSNSINYKAVISEDGNVLANTSVTLKFTILEDVTVKYVETHVVTTNVNGIAIANIGDGTEITGTYTDVIWSNNNHFLKTEVDAGSGFIDMGTTEFHAVPYAISGGSVKELNDLSNAKTMQASTYIGDAAGASNGNAGLWNVGFGREALKSITNRHFNTAIGSQSLSNLTGGSENVALGMSTLFYNKDGGRNTSLGSRSGYKTKGANNIFIGYKAGHNEVGSNKLYIESSDSDTPLIGGDFSTNEVVINGTLQVTGGTPAAGKVLTSDANGKASWETLSTSVKTETITYSPYNIQPSKSASVFERFLGYFIPAASNDKFYIPINIPVGSKVMSMKVYYYDFSNDADINVSIYKKSESAGSLGNWGGITTSGYSTNLENMTSTYGYSSHVLESGVIYLIQIRPENGSWEGSRATSISSIELTYEK